MNAVSPQRPAAMTPEAFKALLKRHGLSYAQAAERLDVTRRTVIRWATGATPIDKRNALYVKALIRGK